MRPLRLAISLVHQQDMAKKASTKKASKKVAHIAPEFGGEIMARTAADAADAKKAEDVLVLDLRGMSPLTDFLVIVTANSLPHLRAVRDEVEDEFRDQHQRRPIVRDGSPESGWLILHYGDVVVHVFLKEKREFYALEDFWSDTPRLAWEPPAPPAPPVAAKKAARKTAKKATAKKKSAA